MADSIKKVWEERYCGAAALGSFLHVGAAAWLVLALGTLWLPAILLPPLLLMPGYIVMLRLLRCPACNTFIGGGGRYCPCCGVDLESAEPLRTNPCDGRRT